MKIEFANNEALPLLQTYSAIPYKQEDTKTNSPTTNH